MAVLTFKDMTEVDNNLAKFKSRCPVCSKGDLTVVSVDTLSLTRKFSFVCTGKCMPVVVEVAFAEIAECPTKLAFATLVSNKYHSASRATMASPNRREEAEW